MNRFARRLAIVVWPAFLVAGVLEVAVFAFVDPSALHGPDGRPLGLSDVAIYSLAFFMFWAIVSIACLIVLKLACSAEEINAESAAR
ncbi:MAG: hypothetical protein IPM15_05215 [Betaproteobacteria bacterium]|jgi:hypothetical protein|nr:hypothetical protein [Betaproteobacteria bacterium]MCC6249680.1 hypothetical protein [Rubrivivax sp.]MCL4698081.1 hypothetical protein [Burkholderiaceae bacterium]